MKILVVEDDQAIAQSLQLLFDTYNYAVDLASNGDAGLQMAEAYDYDLILLDWLLPKMDGITICQRLRSHGFQNPILLLTGQADGHQKAVALNAGADDYVVKPFDAEELVARVQALLRRGGPTSQPVLTWGHLSIDPSSRNVAYNTQLLTLTPKEYALLELFLRHPQQIFSPGIILDHVWTSLESPGEEAVRFHIKELRHKLREVGAPKDLVKTIHRMGYQLNPLYAAIETPPAGQLSAPQIAELNAVNAELRATLEQLRAIQTELQQKNQELAQINQTTEARLQRLNANLAAVVYQYVLYGDGSEGFTYISPQCQNIYELSPEALQQDFNQVWTVIYPGDRVRVQQANLHSAQTLERFDVEFRLLLPSGSLRWVRAVSQPDRQANGDTIWDGLVLDITAEKASETALLASEARYRQVAELTSDIIYSCTVTPTGNLVDAWATAKLQEIFGYSRTEISARSGQWFDLIHPEDQQRAVQFAQAMVQYNGSGVLDYRVIDKQGQIRWVQDRVQAIWDDTAGRVVQLIGAVEDISDRKYRGANATFLSDLTAEISMLSAPAEIMQAVGAKVSAYLQVSHCLLVDIHEAENQAIVEYCWHTEETPDLTGTYRLSDFISEEFRQAARAGETVTVNNIQTDLRTDKDRFAALKMYAFVTIPFHQDGEWNNAFVISDCTPRNWREDELELICELTNRIFPRLERACAEAALQENEQLLRLAMVGAQAGSWSWDLITGKVTWSEENYHLYGLDPSRQPLQYDDWYNAVHPEDRQRVSTDLTQVIEGRLSDYRTEFRITHPQLGIRWLLGLGRLFCDEQGQPIRLYGINLDVTERQQADLEIRKFVALADENSEFIGMCSMDFVPFYINAAGKKIVGIQDLQQFQGTPIREFFFPEDQDFIVNEFFPRVLREGKAEVEIRFRHFQTGAAIWMIYNVICVHDESGQPIALATLSRNISVRKQTEQALQESEQRLQAILEHSPTAVYVMDRQNHFLLANRICAELIARTPEELVGTSIYELWPVETADAFATNNHAVLTTGDLVQTEEIVPHPDGTKHTYITVKFPLRDVEGTPYAVCGLSTDITEKKQLEEQFYRSQRLESLGTLASGIAHDLNNVLTPILTMAQLLRLNNTQLNLRSQEMIRVIEDSAKRGTDMLKQMLTFTRGVSKERVPIQITPLVQEMVEMLQQTFSPAIKLEQNMPDYSLWSVCADMTYLHQVLMNLCVNARDAMPDGGTLSLTVEHCVVDQTFAQANLNAQVGNYVVITVGDTGTGIPPEIRDSIFDPFFTTKPPGQGTGLGLATVLGIVKNYGGFLQVCSEVGQGTQIKVYLPAIAATVASCSSQPAGLSGGNGERVLIVDDDEAVRRSTQALLDSHNYTTLVAGGGEAALTLCEQSSVPIRLVIGDITMPGIDGTTLIEKLQRLDPAMPIIAVSGLAANCEAALAAGARVFLSKPYAAETLLRHIGELIHAQA